MKKLLAAGALTASLATGSLIAAPLAGADGTHHDDGGRSRAEQVYRQQDDGQRGDEGGWSRGWHGQDERANPPQVPAQASPQARQATTTRHHGDDADRPEGTEDDTDRPEGTEDQTSRPQGTDDQANRPEGTKADDEWNDTHDTTDGCGCSAGSNPGTTTPPTTTPTPTPAPSPTPTPAGTGGEQTQAGLDGLTTVAQVLGLTRTQVLEALKSGSSIDQLATQCGSTPAAVQSALTAPWFARVDSALQSGRLSQEQATQLKQAITDFTAFLTGLQFGQAAQPAPQPA